MDVEPRHAPGSGYVFGPYELDGGTRTLLRDGVPVDLAPRHTSVLALLLAHAGAIVSKDDIMQAGWGRLVGDNSVDKVVSDLRLLLGEAPGGGARIESVRRRGFRFVGEVSRKAFADGPAVVDNVLDLGRSWIEGRAALETLKLDEIGRARALFEDVVRRAPDEAPGHVGLANACIMQFEATRADAEPDREALAAAVRHARRATEINPKSGDAWAVLGLALARSGSPVEAVVASRRATMVEPANWRHEVRLAWVAWGPERLHAAQRALAISADLPFARWLAATVFVARQQLDDAEREVAAGIASLEGQPVTGARMSGVGLYLLRGLLQLARGDAAGALASFERELSFEGDGNIYAREVGAHTWHAIGALRLRAGDAAGAAEACEAALLRVPAHPMARAGWAITRRRMGDKAAVARLAEPTFRGKSVDVAMARAALFVEEGRGSEAAVIVADALASPDAGSSGWVLPIEPLLEVAHSSADWSAAVARLRAGAV